MPDSEKLLKRTIRLTPQQLASLQAIANQTGSPMAAIVREAIDAYVLEASIDGMAPELIDQVSRQVRAATADTRRTRKKVEKTLEEISKRRL